MMHAPINFRAALAPFAVLCLAAALTLGGCGIFDAGGPVRGTALTSRDATIRAFGAAHNRTCVADAVTKIKLDSARARVYCDCTLRKQQDILRNNLPDPHSADDLQRVTQKILAPATQGILADCLMQSQPR